MATRFGLSRNPKYLFLLSFFLFELGCLHLAPFVKRNSEHVNKYYLGRAGTDNFQELIEEILLRNNYQIEYFDNGPISSYMTTRWKIRDPNTDELGKGFLEARTRIYITGRIKSGTYDLYNKFRYDCYLEVKNQVFNGEEYVDYYKDKNFRNDVEKIVNDLRTNLDYEK